MRYALLDTEMEIFANGGRDWCAAAMVFVKLRARYGQQVAATGSVELRPAYLMDELDMPAGAWTPRRVDRALKF